MFFFKILFKNKKKICFISILLFFISTNTYATNIKTEIDLLKTIGNQKYKSVFISKKNTLANWNNPNTWNKVENHDGNLLPGENDLVIISSDSTVFYNEPHEKLTIKSIIIQKNGVLNFNRKVSSNILIKGKILVNGKLNILGSHTITFESTASEIAGIFVYPDAEFNMIGNKLSRDIVQEINEDNKLIKIKGIKKNYRPNSLTGKKIKILNGLSKNLVFDIVGNTDDTIIIDIESRGFDKNMGFREEIYPLMVDKNIIQIPANSINNKLIKNRTSTPNNEDGVSGQYVGKWLKFSGSGNMYLITQSISGFGKKPDILKLLKNVSPKDINNSFKITSGIRNSDKYIIIDYAKATIPEFNKKNGINHAVFYAEDAKVTIKYAEFSYFGTSLNNYDAFSRLPSDAKAGGLTFVNFDCRKKNRKLDLQFIDVHHGAAANNINLKNIVSPKLAFNYLWDVHPQINPESRLEAGHGWVFTNIHNLFFEENIVLNQGDDHVFITGNASNLFFENNTFINTPLPVGNSTNNIEMTIQGIASNININGNTLLMSDGNLNIVCYKKCKKINIKNNIIASTLDINAANISLVNSSGFVSNNIIMNSTLGLMVFQNSHIIAFNNVFRNITLSTRNVTKLFNNIFFSTGVSINTEYGIFAHPIEIYSNLFIGSDPKYGGIMTVNDPKNNLNVNRLIYNNTFDGFLDEHYKGLSIRDFTQKGKTYIYKNIIVNSSIGIQVSNPSTINTSHNIFFNNINPYTGKNTNTDPASIEEKTNYNLDPFFTEKSLGYGLSKDSPALINKKGKTPIGFLCAGLIRNQTFTKNLVWASEYLRIRSFDTTTCNF